MGYRPGRLIVCTMSRISLWCFRRDALGLRCWFPFRGQNQSFLVTQCLAELIGVMEFVIRPSVG